MAGVTLDILTNLLQFSLNKLKCFSETLNSELTEEGQEESRESYKEEVSRILNAFAKSETTYQKGVNCIIKVEEEMNTNLYVDDENFIDYNTLNQEIKEIIKIVERKDKLAEQNENLPDFNMDENKLFQQLEKVQDILNEFHPLIFQNEEENNEEEDSICKKLENMQKKALNKLEKSIIDADENDEEYTTKFEEAEELTDSSDEDHIDYDSIERLQNIPRKSNEKNRKNVDTKLKHMWDEYKKRLNDVKSIDAEQLFNEAVITEQNIDCKDLTYYSKYKDKILELFSAEAVVILGRNENYIDPISKMEIQNPLRNKLCGHIYERETICNILKNKNQIACPCFGCSCRCFTVKDLDEDEELAIKISQSKSKKQLSALQRNTENMETENEDERDTENIETDDESSIISEEIL